MFSVNKQTKFTITFVEKVTISNYLYTACIFIFILKALEFTYMHTLKPVLRIQIRGSATTDPDPNKYQPKPIVFLLKHKSKIVNKGEINKKFPYL